VERLGQLAEEKDWRGAAGVDTAEAYQQFLTQHPSGKWPRKRSCASTIFAAAPAAGGSATPAPCRLRRAKPRPVPEAPPVAAAGSAYGVQLGAFSSAERANAEWAKLKADAPGTLDGLEPRVVVGEASGQNHLTDCRPKCATKCRRAPSARTQGREESLRSRPAALTERRQLLPPGAGH
jgi:hypothetical protein